MNNEPNKPVELTEKELEGIVGGSNFTIGPVGRQTVIKTEMIVEKELVGGGAGPIHGCSSVTLLPESARRLR